MFHRIEQKTDGQNGRRFLILIIYPFTAPAATPLMMYFWQDR